MENLTKLKEAIQSLFTRQKLGVLATDSQGEPYTSLVAFTASEDLKTLLFATTRSTRKYNNLSANPFVTLLVDNRSNQEEDFHRAIAVTAKGRAYEVEDSEREECLHRYVSRHPYLEEFVSSPTCALVRIDVDKYFVVSRFQNVQILEINQITE